MSSSQRKYMRDLESTFKIKQKSGYLYDQDNITVGAVITMQKTYNSLLKTKEDLYAAAAKNNNKN